MKKFLPLLFLPPLFCLLGALSCCAPSLSYEKTEGGYRVTGGGGKILHVPALHRGEPVIEIGDGAFEGSDAERVVLPETLRSVGARAFADSALSYISMPAVTEVGTGAFSSCPLQKADLPSALFLGAEAFAHCDLLSSVSFPSLRSLGKSCFAGCEVLSSVSLPATLTDLGTNAFSDCYCLSAVEVGEGNPAFCSLDGILYDADLSSLLLVPDAVRGVVTLPDSLRALPDGAFAEKNELAGICVENNPLFFSLDGVLYRSDTHAVVAAPRKLEGRVRIADGVQEITGEMFYGNTMSEIVFPSSLLLLEATAFIDCENLARIQMEANDVYYAEGNCLIARADRTVVLGGTECDIPKDAAAVGDFAFCYRKELRTLLLPDGIGRLGQDAFSGCALLERVDLPPSLCFLGAYCFYGCRGLKEVTAEGRWQCGGEEIALDAARLIVEMRPIEKIGS